MGVLNALCDKNLLPVVCISENNNTAVHKLCVNRGIDYVVNSTARDKQHINAMKARELNLIVCAGYSKIIPEEIFRDLQFGGINCHGGRLPQYRGASVIPWQIINGEDFGIAYVLKLTAGIDDGPILAQERYAIDSEDTARQVTDKVIAIFKKIMPVVIESFSRGCCPRETPQDKKDVCYWTRRKPIDGLIKWGAMTAKEVVNLVRALDDPYPGAYICRNGRKYIISGARVYPDKIKGVAGRFVGKTEEGALILAKDRAVEIIRLYCDKICLAGKDFPAKYGEDF